MYFSYQNQILLGTVLGGSSLLKPPKGVNYYLSMRGQNLNWIQYKIHELDDYFSTSKILLYGKTYRANSSCSEQLTEFYSKWYDGKKRKITMDILDILTDTGWAVWYLDSGGKTGRNKKNSYLNVTKFGKEGSEIIQEYFTSLDIPCNINRDGERLKLLFTVDGTLEFLKIVAHKFPTFMYHKI